MTFRLQWRGDEAIRRVARGRARGLRNAGAHVLVESQREVPLREGILQDSGRVDVDGRRGTMALIYDTPYAEVQHEREDFNHPNGRKAKYISDPMQREAQVMVGLVAAAIRAELGGAAGAGGGGRRRRR